MAKIYVLHENAEWVVPLEAAFREQGLPYELWFSTKAASISTRRHPRACSTTA